MAITVSIGGGSLASSSGVHLVTAAGRLITHSAAAGAAAGAGAGARGGECVGRKLAPGERRERGAGAAPYSSMKKKLPACFCSLSMTEDILLMRGRKLEGSRRKVISSALRKAFMPDSRLCGACAMQSTDGSPS